MAGSSGGGGGSNPSRLSHLLRFLLLLSTTAVLQPRPASAQQCRLAKRGLSQDILLLGTVLTTDGALPDTAVFIQSGRIAHVGDICNLGLRGGFSVGGDASVVDCTGGGGGGGGSVISPGFINTHEHIDFSTVRPFPDIRERASHRHDWRLGTRGHTMREVAVNGSVENAVAWGELRHLFSGTTSVIGGAMVPGLARNLDFPDGLEAGLEAFPEYYAAVYDTFPLKDKLGQLRDGDCDYGAGAINLDRASAYHRYIGHIGEGVDSAAANEFLCLSNLTYDTIPMASGGGISADIMGPNVALVHALGLTPQDFDVVARRGAMIVWSPRSNMYLYGRTLNATALLASGITVALGTDWLPSGSATMGREAVCAAAVARESLGLRIAPKTLWEMATVNAAVVAGFEEELGSLEVGKLADIVVFGKKDKDGHRDGHRDGDDDNATDDPFGQAIFAPQEAVELVLRGGKVLLASSALQGLTAEWCEPVAFGQSEKIVCVADELGTSFKELETSLQGVYPAILPDMPPEEPTCR